MHDEDKVNHLTTLLHKYGRNPNMKEIAIALLNEGIDLEVPPPPEPSIYRMVQTDSGAVWVRTTYKARNTWLCISNPDYAMVSWATLLESNPVSVAY
jgi:hypothetical protein